MVYYLLPCLSSDNHRDQFDDTLSLVGVAITAYICTLMYIMLLVLLFYNVWNFLYKQGKWKVWTLSLFYVLCVVCLIMRIYVTIYIVCESMSFNVILLLGTAVIKICIGLEQILVIVEIWLKVRQNEEAMTYMKQHTDARAMVNKLVTSKQQVELKVRIIRIVTTVLITIFVLVAFGYGFWFDAEHKDSDVYDLDKRV